eukprot:5058231-Karenia_brevis.AAC.1
MFGETAAVYAFLRISRALAALASRLFWLTVVNYFDDFTQVEPLATSDSAQQSIEELFDLLGWEVAMEAKKRQPFARKFISLGACVDFSS